MRLHIAVIVVLVGALLTSGCSGEQAEGIPLSCREGATALREALRDAPGRVTLGGTPLSECIDDTSGGGALRDVGQAYVYVAARLADQAVDAPDGAAAMQLGYLVGALRRGQFGAQGVGHELSRRLQAELARVDVHSPAFKRGERAGRERG